MGRADVVPPPAVLKIPTPNSALVLFVCPIIPMVELNIVPTILADILTLQFVPPVNPVELVAELVEWPKINQ